MILPLRPALLAIGLAAAAAPATATAVELTACRLKGIEREARCGVIERPENPDTPDARRIPIHFAVVSALAKSKAPDPLFVFVGGPGQSALRLAGVIQPAFAQLNARRDVVYIDQRGTGRSNALACDAVSAAAPLAQQLDIDAGQARLAQCLQRIAREDRADLRQYATWIAMRDVDAVRVALGAQRVNLWGASYGTRAALEYLRQFPQHVRSVVLDGAAPADMALPASFAIDGDDLLRRLTARCANEPQCASRHPRLAADIDRLLAPAESLTAPERIEVRHPLTGERESIKRDPRTVASALRAPLYSPALAALVPYAVTSAAGGDYTALIALAGALSGELAESFAEGMHYAVICAEDLPRMDAAARAAARGTRFGLAAAQIYDDACRHVAVRAVPPDFYAVSGADVPVLVLSGAADPATPPRHGEAIVRKLKRARHLVAPNLGHGVTAHGCAPELVTRFIREANFDRLDATCLEKLPAPPFFQPPRQEAP